MMVIDPITGHWGGAEEGREGQRHPAKLFLKGLKPEPRQESRQPEVTAARVTAVRVTAAEVGAPDFPGDELGTA